MAEGDDDKDDKNDEEDVDDSYDVIDATTCLHPTSSWGPWPPSSQCWTLVKGHNFIHFIYIVGSGGVRNGFLDIFINNKLCMFRICLSAAFYAHLDEGVLGLVWIR